MPKRLFLLLVWPVFFSLRAFPQRKSFMAAGMRAKAQKDNSEADSREALLKGMFYVRNSEFALAEEELNLYRKMEPQDPRGCLELLNNQYFRWVKEKNSFAPKIGDQKYKAFIASINKCLAESDEKIKIGDDPDLYKFVKAHLYSIKAAVQINNDSYVAALDTAGTVVESAQSSHYQCANALVGILNYEASFISWYLKPFLMFVDLPHDRQRGVKLLQKAAENNDTIFADDMRFLVWRALSRKGLKERDRLRYEKIFGISREDLFLELKRKYPNSFILKGHPSKDVEFTTGKIEFPVVFLSTSARRLTANGEQY